MNEKQFKKLKTDLMNKPKSKPVSFLISASEIEAGILEVSRDYFKAHDNEKVIIYQRSEQIKFFNAATNFDKCELTKDEITKKLADNELIISQQYFNRVSRKIAANNSKISLEKVGNKNYWIIQK